MKYSKLQLLLAMSTLFNLIVYDAHLLSFKYPPSKQRLSATSPAISPSASVSAAKTAIRTSRLHLKDKSELGSDSLLELTPEVVLVLLSLLEIYTSFELTFALL